MVYLPPVTSKGLHDRIKHWIQEDNDFKQFSKTYNLIQNDKKLKAVWDAAIELSFLAMGGKDQSIFKGDNTTE